MNDHTHKRKERETEKIAKETLLRNVETSQPPQLQGSLSLLGKKGSGRGSPPPSWSSEEVVGTAILEIE